MDAEAYRAESRERWERIAPGWEAQREFFRKMTEPVTRWLVDHLQAGPGSRVLELAAGPGEVGFTLAERLRPDGRLISTDSAEAMVELANEAARERGLEEVVEARVMDAESIELPTASIDGVLCRWGFMLMADPGAALRESRRVLKPGGRIALATWDVARRNPWSSVVGAELVQRGLMERPRPGEPGQFAWADTGVIAEHLGDAGFTGVEVETVEFTYEYPDLDTWWDVQLDMGAGARAIVEQMTPAERDDLRDALDARLQDYVRDDGTLVMPAAAHVAAADA